MGAFILCVVLLSASLVLFSSCGKKIKDITPYREEFKRLIEESFLVNEILFGEGLPVYNREECLGELIYSKEKNDEYVSYFRSTDGKDFPESLYEDKGEMFRLYHWIYKDATLTAALSEPIYICKYSTTYYVLEGTKEDGSPDYDMVTEISYALKRENADAAIPAILLSEGYAYKDADGAVTSTVKASSEVLYTTAEGALYYALAGYEEPSFEYEYDKEENEYYDVVRFDSEYLTIESIKELCEKVYSSEYLKAIYSSLFDGIRTDFSDDSSAVLLARYIEEAGSDGMLYLKKSNVAVSLFEKQRTYDYESMKIRKPYNKDRVNVEITAYGEYYSSETKQVENGAHTVRLSFVIRNGVWRLDAPTY